MAFTFKHGDRVLDQYTIQRAVGRGGFGEVYYALSDGGREVAIKHLRDNPDVELRGVAHCINLKSPHLVSIFDVRKNEHGEYFIIMEYISGASLRDLLTAEPHGLGVAKAVFFLKGIASGLSYLHERGIVHRDLKPGNIFYDDGYVKIGDYGLSKFISVSRHSVQTASVGTVHYMAPEVGSGSYTRSIDVYALGVILYEMLLGRVPFEGASMGEVLMKHLTQQPEVDRLPAPFAQVIRKALAKDPKDRYATVDEMMQDVLGVEDVQRSLAGFNPEMSLTHAARAGYAERFDSPRPSPNPRPAERGAAWAPPPPPPIGAPEPAATLIPRRDRTQRMLLTGLMAVGMSFLSGLATAAMSEFRTEELAASAGLMTLAGSGGILLGRKVLGWLGASAYPTWAKRVVMLVCAGLPLLFGAAPALSDSRVDGDGGAMLLSLLILVMFADWSKAIHFGSCGALNAGDAFRKALGAFAAAVPLAGVLDGEPAAMFGSAAIAMAITLVLQASGWWLQPASGAAPATKPAGAGGAAEAPFHQVEKRLRDGAVFFRMQYPRSWNVASPTAPPVSPAPPHWVGGPQEAGVQPGGAGPAGEAAADVPPQPALRSGFARAFWSIVAFTLLIGVVVSVVALAVMGRTMNTPQAPIIALIGCAMGSLFALSKTTVRRRVGFWRETMRPLLLAGTATAIGAAITLIADPPMSRGYRQFYEGVYPNGQYVYQQYTWRNHNVRPAMIPVLVASSLMFVTVAAARGRRSAAPRPFLMTDSSHSGAAPPPRPSAGPAGNL
ncbi:MAG: Serine/threonine-protein kinase PknD [Phycisphaerae bacterium]|nr:Serine/threonine-protein kinase PknD [Phycisphaerae bacterium]